jgi:hypothetical protein
MAHRSGSGTPGPARHGRPGFPPVSRLLAQPDPGPRDLTPRRARVTIREIPQPPRRDWAGWWRRHWADIIALAVVGAAAAALLLR